MRVALIVFPEQVDDVLDVGRRPHWRGNPSRFRQDVMRVRSSRSHELVANLPRKREIRERPMQVAQLAAPETEFDAAEPMRVSRHAVPLLDGLPYRVTGFVLRHVRARTRDRPDQ